MKLNNILEAQQFNPDLLKEIFQMAKEISDIVVKDYLDKRNNEEWKKLQKGVKGKRMISLFYESSTRTRASFEIAMRMLGGEVVFSTENAREFSSAAKGETLEDTIKVLNMYLPHLIVLRHYEIGAAQRAANVSQVPIINAGDGAGQHPTQALLDLYTIWEKFEIDGLKIAMVGDLANGRTVRSLSYLLGKYSGVKIFFVSPPILKMKDDIKEYLAKHQVQFEEVDCLEKIANEVMVVYQTRIQRERLGDRAVDYESFRQKCAINSVILTKMKTEAIVMHPLPRDPIDGTLPPSIDISPKAFYFKQAQNGLFVRMALLKMILS